MNLRKMFLYKLLFGFFLLIATFVLYLFPGLVEKNVHFLLVPAFANIVNIFFITKLKEQDPDNVVFFQRTAKATGMIFIPFLIILMFVWNAMNTNISSVTLFLCFSLLITSTFIIHALLGVYLLKHNKTSITKSKAYEIFDLVITNPDTFIIINYGFFFETIFGGLFILSISFGAASFANLRIILAIPLLVLIVFPLQYFINVKNKKQNKMDEREKSILYKITSYSFFIYLFFVFALYAFNNSFIQNIKISEGWGALLVSAAFIIWGFVGLIILKRESQ